MDHEWGLQCELFTPGKTWNFNTMKCYIHEDIEQGYVFRHPPRVGDIRLESLDNMRVNGFTEDDLRVLGLV